MTTTVSPPPEIKYFNRTTGQTEVEKVYGDWFINFLYCSVAGQRIGGLFTNKYFSKFYGKLQDLPTSHKKVRPFIEKFNIPIDDYEPGSLPAKDIRDSYRTFNEFFVRKFKLGKRHFVSEPNRMPALAEARYVGFEAIDEKRHYPVKGHYLLARDLIGNDQVAKIFDGGPLMIARLCPVDYHRYHYPDNGKVLDHFRVAGTYDSVNPLALKYKNQIFMENERYVTILQTENFGRLAYIEVGAICVGKIVQSHPWKKPFSRGEEKGYFLFGGSTVILLGEKGLWKPSADMIANTANGIETYLHIGDEAAVKC
ncbi:MAG TPA: phosphatidylserine decarboxylase [Bacteriovoracaceae bacterium]|nr:phosphatidylserine decarboxylase [Bacteriovoracaceae bacterium]